LPLRNSLAGVFHVFRNSWAGDTGHAHQPTFQLSKGAREIGSLSKLVLPHFPLDVINKQKENRRKQKSDSSKKDKQEFLIITQIVLVVVAVIFFLLLFTFPFIESLYCCLVECCWSSPFCQRQRFSLFSTATATRTVVGVPVAMRRGKPDGLKWKPEVNPQSA